MSEPRPTHRSALAEHPDVKAVLPVFVGRLRGHVARLRQLHGAGNREEFRRLVHQLRGAGKSFGFAPISERAGAIEEVVLAGRPLSEVGRALEELIAYMEHVEGYGVG